MFKAMILVIDGCSPEYLTEETAPNIYRLAKEKGFVKTVQCAMPSVTNVNHACILSGKWPQETGVTGNYFYDPVSGNEGFIEERGYMKAPTILQRYKEKGGRTALLTVKDKIIGVYGDGADIAISAQKPDLPQLKQLGLKMPPAIQSIDSTRWIMEAAYKCIELNDPDFVYCTTNDYIFHHFAPGQKESSEQISAIDEYINKISNIDPSRQIYITADHGMNQKTTIVNFQTILAQADFDVYCLPPLKDRYVENHIYQEGGMLYVFLKDKKQKLEFVDFVKKCPCVEQILSSEEAASLYHLPSEQIGDYVLFSKKDCAFGEIDGEILYTEESRTHGSLYEREIPLIAIQPAADAENYAYNKDIVSVLLR